MGLGLGEYDRSESLPESLEYLTDCPGVFDAVGKILGEDAEGLMEQCMAQERQCDATADELVLNEGKWLWKPLR